MTLYKRIGNRIRQARETLGLSQEELARLVGRSSTAISYFETGARRVKIEDLQRLAKVLNKPIDYFLQQEPEDELVAILRRARQELSPRAYQQMEAFLSHLKEQGVSSRLKFDLSGFKPYAAAEQLLRLAEVGSPPVPVKDVAEQAGVPVFEWLFEDEISAVLVRSQQFTAIGVNRDHPPTRQRFSVAHELGHATLGHKAEPLYIKLVGPELAPERNPQREEDEREANWFAADLLMPKVWIEKDWKRLRDVSEMAKLYKVSEQAMWIRLQQFKLVPLPQEELVS